MPRRWANSGPATASEEPLDDARRKERRLAASRGTIRTSTRAAALIGAALALAACADGAGPRTVEAPAERAYVGDGFSAGASSAERFGLTGGAPGGGVAPGADTATAAADAFDYDLPDGWEAVAPTSMRVVNLRVASEPRAECTLVLLGGDAGGLRANIDRWRGQMGLGPLDDAAFEALPTSTLLGRDAARVDLVGAYGGMSGEKQTGFRMLGLLAVDPAGSAFLKFTGPADVIAANEDGFDRVAATLAVRETDDAAPTPAGAGSTATAGAPGAAGASGSAKLRWTAPDGWVQGPERMMREVTFLMGSSGETECYISILGGDGGGIAANFDRWRGQMGADPLSSDAFADLPRVDCLGGDAITIEIEGHFTGMGSHDMENALMLGAVASLDDSTVFVKLVGPKDEAAAERENFDAFLASLEPAR